MQAPRKRSSVVEDPIYTEDALRPRIRELQISADLALMCRLEPSRGASLAKIRSYAYGNNHHPTKLAKYLSSLAKIEVRARCFLFTW